MSIVLVTGGAGFIGSHLVRKLLEQGHTVRIFDNLSTGKPANIEAVQADVEWIEGDLRDQVAVRRATQKVEVVWHQGALPSVARSVEDPHTTNAVNVEGTLNVLLAARDAGARRVIAASSSSVYGDSPTLPKVETMLPMPLSPYGLSKLATEYYTCMFTPLYGLEAVALRYFNVFGPRQDPSSAYSGVISRFCVAAVRGTPYTINGDGLQSRDFTFVDDVVQANLRAADAPAAAGQAFNIACGTRTTLLDIVAELNRLIGRELPVEYQPARTGDIRDSLADISKAQRLLDYAPTVSFAEGLRRTFEWYREHVY